MFIRSWSVRARLLTLVSLLIGGALIFMGFSYNTLQVLQRKDSPYHNFLQGSDSIVDLMLPRQYVVEAYLLTQQMLYETEPEELQRLIAQGGTLETKYEARHADRIVSLPDGPSKEAITEKAYRSARAFFSAWTEKFLPLVLQGERGQAQALASGELQTHFQTYYAAVDEAVRLANEQMQADERDVREELSRQTIQLMSVGVGLLTFLAVSGWWLTRGILRSLRQLMERVQSATSGER